MGFRFRQSIKLLPGIRLNVGKTVVSVSLGRRGNTINFGRRGIRHTLGIPGTGISYTRQLASRVDERRPFVLPPVVPAVPAEGQSSSPPMRSSWLPIIVVCALLMVAVVAGIRFAPSAPRTPVTNPPAARAADLVAQTPVSRQPSSSISGIIGSAVVLATVASVDAANEQALWAVADDVMAREPKRRVLRLMLWSATTAAAARSLPLMATQRATQLAQMDINRDTKLRHFRWVHRPPVQSEATALPLDARTVQPAHRALSPNRCQAITRKGTQCLRKPALGSAYCW